MKKLYALFLSLVMMFAFASTAMAADTATLKVVINGDVVAENVAVNVGDSVYTAVDNWAKANNYVTEWKEVDSQLGGKGYFLISLDGYASEPYNSPVLGAYEYYDSTVKDDFLKEANAVLLKAFPASQGLGLWIGNGTGFGKTGNYGIYVGQDWMFTVNGERPNNGQGVDYYMNQAIIEAGDVIVLTYGMVYEPFAM